eukprot:1183279-Alexandrium_andersonii.AAC.1
MEGLSSFITHGPLRAPDLSHSQVARVRELGELVHGVGTHASKVDITEICSGEGLASHVAARRHVHAGPNYDLASG